MNSHKWCLVIDSSWFSLLTVLPLGYLKKRVAIWDHLSRGCTIFIQTRKDGSNILRSTRKKPGLSAMHFLHMRRKFSEALEMYDKACSCSWSHVQKFLVWNEVWVMVWVHFGSFGTLEMEALERVPDDLTYHNNKRFRCIRIPVVSWTGYRALKSREPASSFQGSACPEQWRDFISLCKRHRNYLQLKSHDVYAFLGVQCGWRWAKKTTRRFVRRWCD